LALLLAASGVHAEQAFPTKPIRLVVPDPSGSVLDAVARPLALKLTEIFKQPVVVDNCPGNSEINSILQLPTVKERLAANGIVPQAAPPSASTNFSSVKSRSGRRSSSCGCPTGKLILLDCMDRPVVGVLSGGLLDTIHFLFREDCNMSNFVNVREILQSLAIDPSTATDPVKRMFIFDGEHVTANIATGGEAEALSTLRRHTMRSSSFWKERPSFKWARK
jgi:hypothetical protein